MFGKTGFLLIGILLVTMTTPAFSGDGLVTRRCSADVEKTVEKLVSVLESEGMIVFRVIDHADGARKVGKSLKPTVLVIFGNPKVGTPLMRCSRTVAIDLPQKALIWEDESGKVWLAYNDPYFIAKRHGIEGCESTLKKIENALRKFSQAAGCR